MTRNQRRPLVALLLALVVAATATVGSAATLTVNAATISSPAYSGRCSAATVGFTNASATSVTLTIPAGCHGLSGKLRLVGASGALAPADTTFTLPASGATATITVPAYTQWAVTSVALVIDGWGMPTAWTYSAPLPAPTSVIVAGNGDTVVTVGDWFTSGTRTCAPVTAFITTGNKTWRINVNTASAPFSGAAPVFTGQDAAKVTTIGAPGGWQLVGGIPPYDVLHHTKDVPLVFNICG